MSKFTRTTANNYAAKLNAIEGLKAQVGFHFTNGVANHPVHVTCTPVHGGNAYTVSGPKNA